MTLHRRWAARRAWRVRALLAALLALPAWLLSAWLGPWVVALALLPLAYPARREETRALAEIDRELGLAYRTALETPANDPAYPRLRAEAERAARAARLPRPPWREAALALALWVLVLAASLPGRAPAPPAEAGAPAAPERAAPAASEPPPGRAGERPEAASGEAAPAETAEPPTGSMSPEAAEDAQPAGAEAAPGTEAAEGLEPGEPAQGAEAVEGAAADAAEAEGTPAAAETAAEDTPVRGEAARDGADGEGALAEGPAARGSAGAGSEAAGASAPEVPQPQTPAGLPSPWAGGAPPEAVQRAAERYLQSAPLPPDAAEAVRRYFELEAGAD